MMSREPRIGEVITIDKAKILCNINGLDYLVYRLQQQPHLYRFWIFDGVSGIPDWIFRLLGDQHEITYRCALPHDLAYAYGQPGNKLERKLADQRFYHNLRRYGQMSPLASKVCYYAVRLLGSESLGTSFTWGFADQRVNGWSHEPLPWTY